MPMCSYKVPLLQLQSVTRFCPPLCGPGKRGTKLIWYKTRYCTMWYKTGIRLCTKWYNIGKRPNRRKHVLLHGFNCARRTPRFSGYGSRSLQSPMTGCKLLQARFPECCSSQDAVFNVHLPSQPMEIDNLLSPSSVFLVDIISLLM